MTTENIFAHEWFIGATVWLGESKFKIVNINDDKTSVRIMSDDKTIDFWVGIDGTIIGINPSYKLSWVKQDFVLGEPPKPKLKPLEFKGVPVLAFVGTLDTCQILRWVIGYKHGNFVCLNSSNHSFLEAIMNQDFSSGLINFIESKCAWEIPE